MLSRGTPRPHWARVALAVTLTWAVVSALGAALVAPCLPAAVWLFNVVDDIAGGVAVTGDIFIRIAGLGAGYIAVYLLVGWLFFAWREL